jgi:hypothetical protein
VRSSSKKRPLPSATIVKDADLVIPSVLELSLSPSSLVLASRPRLLDRKLKHDTNRLVFDLQRESTATARVPICADRKTIREDQ